MKKISFARGLLSIMLVSALGFLPGCGDKEQPQGDTEGTSGKEVKEEVKEAYDATKGYAQEKMQAFQEQMESRLAEYDGKIDQLETKTKEMGEDARAKAEEELTALRQKRDEVSRKLKGLSSSSKDAWEEMKSGINSAMEDLDKAYEKAAAEFSESS